MLQRGIVLKILSPQEDLKIIPKRISEEQEKLGNSTNLPLF